MIREELERFRRVEERHRRLAARLLIAFALTLVVFAIGTVSMWLLEAGRRGSDIHSIGDAASFFSSGDAT
jgi:hypothetical protein